MMSNTVALNLLDIASKHRQSTSFDCGVYRVFLVTETAMELEFCCIAEGLFLLEQY